jgi:hypothetical protein
MGILEEQDVRIERRYPKLGSELNDLWVRTKPHNLSGSWTLA